MRLLRRGAGLAHASIWGGAYTLWLIACAGQVATENEHASVHGDLVAAEVNEAALSSEATCDALLGRLQSVLLAQVNERAEQARNSSAIYYGGGVFIDDVAPAPIPDFVAAPAAAPATGALNAAAPSGFSQTTVDVPGVDSGDFVKAEGDRIYLLHGSTLYVLSAWPANATLVLGTIPIEGEGAELHVHDGTVAVLSRLYGPLPGTPEIDSPYYYYYPSFTKLTVIDTSGDELAVARESYIEGDSYSSRRTGSVVRAVVQQYSKAQLDYPSVSYTDIFGNPRSQVEVDLQVDLWALLATESIEDSRIEDYLPTAYDRVAGELVARPLDCGEFLVPAGTLTQAGNTSVVSLDLDAPSAPFGTLSLLGYADSVYVNEDSLVLWQTDYEEYASAQPTVHTNVHLFALDGTAADYTASGRVEGYISGLGLDEVGGVVRTATTQDNYETISEGGVDSITYVGTTSRVLTLRAEDGVLSELGRTPDLAPSQSLYAARFAGDRAYLTTFSADYQLQVVDLSDAEAPELAGSVATRGPGSVLIPLANDRLFSIGDSYDPITYTQSLTLQLFDASDAEAPVLAHELAYGPNTYSEATYDARAVSFHPTRSVLSLPVQNGNGTSLEVFELSDEDGFVRLAGIAPDPVEFGFEECLVLLGYPTDPVSIEQLESDPAFVASILQQCDLNYQQVARRGLFRDNYVYAVASRSVSVYTLDPGGEPPLSQIDLPPASYYPAPGFPIPLTPPPAIEGAPAPSDEPSE